MAKKAKNTAIQHLTMRSTIPINRRDQSNYRCCADKVHQIGLTNKKFALIEKRLEVAKKAAQYCLDRFYAHQPMLWYEVTDKEGQIVIKNDRPITKVTNQLSVVIKLQEVAPLWQFELPAGIRYGVYNKVADLLTSYAERSLDPRTAEHTSYPKIEGNWPLVYQLNDSFRFFDHVSAGRLYLYLPLHSQKGGRIDLNHEEPCLRRFNDQEVSNLSKLKRGILIPLQFDKGAETKFVRDSSNRPGWKKRSVRATARPRHQRYLEALTLPKDFCPKRVEVFLVSNRLQINFACEVPIKPPINEVKNFMGVAFGLEYLISVVIIDAAGHKVFLQNIAAEDYENLYFHRLARLKEHKKPFHQELAAFLYSQLGPVVETAVKYSCQVAIEEVGVIDKGKYSPAMNQRLSFWPFGKCRSILDYKLKGEGLPQPFSRYSGTVRWQCSSCGAVNKKGDCPTVSIEGLEVVCQSCGKTQNAGLNAAMNLARAARELYQQQQRKKKI